MNLLQQRQWAEHQGSSFDENITYQPVAHKWLTQWYKHIGYDEEETLVKETHPGSPMLQSSNFPRPLEVSFQPADNVYILSAVWMDLVLLYGLERYEPLLFMGKPRCNGNFESQYVALQIGLITDDSGEANSHHIIVVNKLLRVNRLMSYLCLLYQVPETARSRMMCLNLQTRKERYLDGKQLKECMSRVLESNHVTYQPVLLEKITDLNGEWIYEMYQHFQMVVKVGGKVSELLPSNPACAEAALKSSLKCPQIQILLETQGTDGSWPTGKSQKILLCKKDSAGDWRKVQVKYLPNTEQLIAMEPTETEFYPEFEAEETVPKTTSCDECASHETEPRGLLQCQNIQQLDSAGALRTLQDTLPKVTIVEDHYDIYSNGSPKPQRPMQVRPSTTDSDVSEPNASPLPKRLRGPGSMSSLSSRRSHSLGDLSTRSQDSVLTNTSLPKACQQDVEQDIRQQQQTLSQRQGELERWHYELLEKERILKDNEKRVSKLDAEFRRKSTINEQRFKERERTLDETQQAINNRLEEITKQEQDIAEKRIWIMDKEDQLNRRENAIIVKERELEKRSVQLGLKKEEIENNCHQVKAQLDAFLEWSSSFSDK